MTTTIEVPNRARTYLKLGLLAAGLFLSGTNAFVIAGLLPNLADEFNSTEASIGYSVTVYALVIAVAAPAASILLARVSRTTLIASGLVLMSAGTLITAITSSVEIFTLGRAVAALGGAVLVPTATAAGPALMPPQRAATAIAFITLGFSLATAVGAPLGTALGASFGWRAPFYIIAILALILAAVVALLVRGVPIPPSSPVLQRLRPLRDIRVDIGLITTLLLILGFNVVYLFSASVTSEATGNSGSLLAILLFVFGLGGVAGNLAAGPITDRFSARTALTVFLGIQAVVLILIAMIGRTFWVSIVLFAVWGATALAAPVPVQQRLATINPPTAGLALSWFTSAQYLGIALAPILAASAAGIGGAQLLPLVGAASLALAILAFQWGFVAKRRNATSV